MSVSTVHAVYFSGTGTTEKTVRRIARRLADKLGAAYAEYSYTLPDARKRELTVPAGDLAVVGCPTYAGRVPNLLMPYLRDMVHGAGALAVPVALFGNRDYDDALMELSKLLTADGFTCVAGAAFVGEHSFSPHAGRRSSQRRRYGGDGRFCRPYRRPSGGGGYRARHRRRLRPHPTLLYAP